MQKTKIYYFFLASFLLTTVFWTACHKNNLDQSLHLVIHENPKNLDPVASSDALASEIIGNTYETLLQFHYLKRPYELTPLLAESLPDYSKDGKIVTIKLKSNVYFQDDACFPNKKGRLLTSQDFIYSIKRLADPRNRSEGWWTLDGKILGLNEWRKSPDYKKNVEGLIAPDSQTLVLRLTKKFPQLNYILAMRYLSPVPHEAIDHYGPDISSHTVGTGPFIVKEFVRNSHVSFEKNPNFREEFFPKKESPVPGATPAASDLDYGKQLPLTEKIKVHIVKEKKTAWLRFLKSELDLMRLPREVFSEALNGNKELKEDLVKAGIEISKDPSTTHWFIGFNLLDPILGKNKKLRKAIGLAYNSIGDLELFANGLGRPTNQILPPGIFGFDSRLSPREYNLEKAKELLKEAGYPDGKGLPTFTFDVGADTTQRQIGEYVKIQLAKIGLKINVRMNARPELLTRKRKSDFQMHMDGWVADYPDAENFMQLLYGKNKAPGPNHSSFDNKKFNAFFEEMAVMAPSVRRQKLIKQMNEIFLEETPWIPNWSPVLFNVRQGWLKNYIFSDFSYNNYKYYRVDWEQKRRHD